MKPNTKIEKDEARKKRRAANEWWWRYIQDLRRRQQHERDRRRKLLLLLLLWALQFTPVQMFFPWHIPAPRPVPAKRSPRRSEKQIATADARSDDERRYLYDYAPRHGEEHMEVYDGLSYADIAAYNREHRPNLFPKFIPIPGMPDRYADEPVHIWQLLDHLDSDYHRPDAFKALRLIVDPQSRDWIDACAAETYGLTWKDLRRQCRRRTPDATLYEFPRAAARWREQVRREAEESKREAKETPDNEPKPPGSD